MNRNTFIFPTIYLPKSTCTISIYFNFLTMKNCSYSLVIPVRTEY